MRSVQDAALLRTVHYRALSQFSERQDLEPDGNDNDTFTQTTTTATPPPTDTEATTSDNTITTSVTSVETTADAGGSETISETATSTTITTAAANETDVADTTSQQTILPISTGGNRAAEVAPTASETLTTTTEDATTISEATTASETETSTTTSETEAATTTSETETATPTTDTTTTTSETTTSVTTASPSAAKATAADNSRQAAQNDDNDNEDEDRNDDQNQDRTEDLAPTRTTFNVKLVETSSESESASSVLVAAAAAATTTGRTASSNVDNSNGNSSGNRGGDDADQSVTTTELETQAAATSVAAAATTESLVFSGGGIGGFANPTISSSTSSLADPGFTETAVSSGPQPSGGISQGAIAGATIGGLALFVIIGLLLFIGVRRFQNKSLSMTFDLEKHTGIPNRRTGGTITSFMGGNADRAGFVDLESNRLPVTNTYGPPRIMTELDNQPLSFGAPFIPSHYPQGSTESPNNPYSPSPSPTQDILDPRSFADPIIGGGGGGRRHSHESQEYLGPTHYSYIPAPPEPVVITAQGYAPGPMLATPHLAPSFTSQTVDFGGGQDAVVISPDNLGDPFRDQDPFEDRHSPATYR